MISSNDNAVNEASVQHAVNLPPDHPTEGARTEAGDFNESLEHFGNYRVIRTLGTGGMGEVYLAEDVTTGQKVALKLLQHRASKQARLRRRFERESTLIQDLQHDHIVPLLASGVDDGTQFLVMRYINGQTLADRIVKENGNADTRPIRRDQTATPTTRESVSKPRVPPAIPSSSLPNRLPMWRMHCKSLTTNGSSTATSNLLT